MKSMKQFLLLAMTMLIGMTSHHVQGQMIIDTWGFTTGVDTTLWMDLGADYTVLFSTTNGTQNHASSGLRDIGFPFTLGATTHTMFSTNVNGTVRLGTAQLPNNGYIAEPLGQNINAGPRIDALGRAGMIDTGCYMRSAVLGDSGSRVLVVEARLREYADMGSAESHYVHFQVQLFEAGGLRIVYGQVDSGAIYGSSQNGVAATGNSSNKDVIFFDFAAQRAVRFNGNCTLRNAVEDYPTRGRWYMLAPDPTACPRATASTVWVTNYSAAGVELTQSMTDARNYRLRVAGTDIDTLWNAAQATFTLPTLNPRTDYTLSLQTLCGSDTSYFPFNITITTGCGAVVWLPWSTTFPSLSHSDCWDMPYVSGNNADFTRRWRQTSTTAYVYCSEAAGTYNSWLISPVVYLPDGDGLTLQWDYRALLSSSGVAPHVELRVAPCAEDGTAADGAWSTLMVLDGEYQSYTALAANLDAWRGQRVRVAWVRTGEGGGSAYVDNVSLYRQQEPQLLREVPSVAFAGDTTLYTASMFAGVDSNVVFTWHSSLLDSTIVTTDSIVSEVYVVYPAAGIDTVTVVLSNAYGSEMATAVVEVADCRTVTALPWSNDFAGSYACWTINGWQRASSTLAYNENGDYTSHDNVMYPNNTGKYMLTQPVTIPATGVEHLSLWAEADGPLMVRVSPTASTDTASYTDTLLTVPNSSRIEIFWRTAGLAAYAGQTVRFGFFKTAGTQAFVRRVKVDYDTLPALGNMVVPAISRTDSTIACSVELLRGVGEGVTYTWHSSLMDTTWVGTGANGSHGFNVTYTIGGTDTITVVAANAYGSDTMVRTVQVMDCRPVTALPWREDFDDDLSCWYQTYNSTNNRWLRGYRYSAPYYINDYDVGSSCNFSESLTTPVDAWLVSRAITIPADTALAVRLFWHVGISSGNNLTNNYRVMVSTAADCTDTTAYEELYHDTLPLPNQYNMAQRSVSLTPYAGQTIYIAFRNQPLVRRATALLIDKVEVRETTKPRLLLAADNVTFYHGDTATFTATLTEGSDSNLVYTWHSSLLDSTWVDTAAGGQWRLTYGMTGGMDTVTLVATNAYGSDTATVCVSSVIDSLPSISHIAHGAAFVGDTTEYTVVDNRSVVTGQTYTWHSTLLDTSIVLQSSQAAFRLVYTAEGNDTVTVVKSNVFGSSTSSVVVAVGSHPLPEVALTIPAWVEVGVAAEFEASINDCSVNGRTFTWHSTLLDTTIATLLPTLALMYEAEGTDTLTVIASNAYGADTTVTVFEVVDCSARAIPYTEDFEGVAPTASDTLGELPACWNLGWNGSNAAYGPHVITTGGYQYISNIPDNALFLVAGSSTGYGNTAEVSLPRMADSLQNLSLAFDYRFESSSYGTLTVGYYNANNVFTTVKTMPAQNGSYRRDTVSFAAATVPDAAMVLRWYHGSSWYAVVIDNIEVFHDAAPHAPATVTVDSIGITHARVNWTAGVNATAYRVVVDGVVDTTVSGLSVVLHGLAARTQYTVRVASLAGNDTSSYATAQFTTLCGAQPLPYCNDFSQGSASTTCWASANLNQFFLSGYMIIWSGLLAKPSYQITPVIEHPAGQMVVSFRAMKYGTSTQESGRLIVGVMTDPADTTTFIAIDTVMTTSSTWAEYRIGVRGLGTTPVAIAFCVGTGDGEFCNVAIDYLTIDAPVPCPQLVAVEATSIDARSVELSWQYDALGGLPVEGVLVTLHDLTSGDSSVFVSHGTDTILGGLPLVHSFRADLRVLCSGDTSETVSVSFAPEASACVEVTGSNGTYPVTCYPISADKNYGYSQTLYPAVLAAAVDTLYGIALRTAGLSNETRTLDVYIGQTAANTLTSPISVATHTLAAHSYQFNPGSGWARILFDTPVPLDGVSNLIVTIDDNTGNWGNPVSHYAHQSTPGVMLYYDEQFDPTVNVDPVALGFSVSSTTNIPDIQLLGHCATDRCLQPLISLTPDTNAILVAWNQRGSESLWRVEYRLEGSANWLLADTTGETTYVINGLNASSRYEVRVGAVCSGSNVVYSDVAVAATPCGAVAVPYHQNFMANDIPCWNLNGICSSQWGFTLIHPHPLVSPAILGDLTQMQVRVTVKGSPYINPTVKVGVGDATGYGNVTWIDSMMFSTETPTDYTVYLSGYSGSENHIVLSTTNQDYVRIEDFVIEYMGCQPVHHVSVNQLSDTGAVLTWPPVADEGNWAVYLDNNLVAVVDTPYYSLAALAPGTDYSVQVREICSAGDTSIAATAAFTTLCTEQTLPWTEDFENYPSSSGYTTGVEIPCWHTILPAINVASYVSLVRIGFSNNSHTLRFYDHRYVTQHDAGVFIYAASSPVNTAGHSATVEFDLQVERVPQSPNQPFIFQAGIMTDVTDTTTFIPMVVVDNPGDTHCLFLTDTLSLPDRFSVAFRFQGDITADVDNLTVTAIPLPMHNLTLSVNDTAMGTVSGAGTYEEGTNVTITATANEGYHFVTWSDGITASTRTVKVDFDTSFTAFFAPDTLWHIVTVGASNDGACQTYGSGTYIHGDTVEIGYHLLDTASAGGHWVILGWNDGNADNPRQVVVTSDTTFTLLCQWVGDSVGINDAPEGNNRRVNIYPNPATTTVRVECEGWNAETATLLDLNGRVVSTQTIQQSNSQAIILDISMLPRGTYFLRLTDRTTTAIRKLILQ